MEGGKGQFPLNISRGRVGGKKLVNHEKTTLPIQEIFGKFLYLGAFIQFGANLCGKNLKLYILYIYIFEEISNLCFWGKFHFWGALSVW